MYYGVPTCIETTHGHAAYPSPSPPISHLVSAEHLGYMIQSSDLHHRGLSVFTFPQDIRFICSSDGSLGLHTLSSVHQLPIDHPIWVPSFKDGLYHQDRFRPSACFHRVVAASLNVCTRPPLLSCGRLRCPIEPRTMSLAESLKRGNEVVHCATETIAPQAVNSSVKRPTQSSTQLVVNDVAIVVSGLLLCLLCRRRRQRVGRWGGGRRGGVIAWRMRKSRPVDNNSNASPPHTDNRHR